MTDLINYLPGFWHSIAEMSAIQNGISPQLDVQKNDCTDILNQCFIVSATWGLDLWENELGIIRNPELSYAERRAALFSKLLGTATSTALQIQKLTESVTGGKCDVVEHNAEYWFVLKFTMPQGYPNNINQLINAINICKPAHLNFKIQLLVTWNDVKEYTWGNINKKFWTYFE